MARWILVLMIALLPLRGWVGDAMAGEMLQKQVAGASIAAQAPAATLPAPAEHADCMGHTAPPAGEPQSADCPTCASCQACSALAMSAPDAAAAPAFAIAHPRPASRDRGHRSAERTPAFKPHIS